LFRTFFELNIFPDEWKLSIVTPIFKKGAPSDPKNYRPIALTCTACKIFESLISSEILDYLNSYNLITPHQHGFLKKHSTATNLLESINDWSLSLSRRHSVDIAYIDFCRAFDAISHSKLLLKLSAYGFSGNLYLWIKAFLSDRKQLVRINSSCSSICSVLSGVIQGSVLGPLLFNVFINDVTDTLDNDTTAKLFADDLKLYTNITTSSTHNLQHQLNNIYLWSNAWQLPISFSKCTILHLGKSKNQFQYHFQNIPINESVHPTDLGIIIDPNLRFTDHVQAIVSRARIRSAQIIRCFLSRNILLMTRAFNVRPTLEYASTIWSPSRITQIIFIEGVQRSFTKRLPGLANLSYTERIKILKLQSLEHRRLLLDLVQTFKIIHNLSSLKFADFFPYPTYNSTRGHSHRLAVPIFKSDVRKHSFACRVVPVWNSLPNEIITAKSLFNFKAQIRQIDLGKFLILPTFIDSK